MQMNKHRRIEGIRVATKSVKAIEADGADCFTCLPDKVINKIFLFLSMKDAYRTCISSKKLRHLWTYIPHLEFGIKGHFIRSESDRKKWAPVEIVDRFLEHHNGPIRSFRLALCCSRDNFDVDRWISLLMQSGIEELDLDILPGWNCDQYKLPSCLFGFETIRVLKLRRCIFNPPRKFHGFGSLETIVLCYMSLSDNLIRCLLSNCMSLRIMTLKRCDGFQKIDISSPNIRLEHLTLKYCSAAKLNAPNLQTLYYYCDTAKLSLKGASEVANAVVFRCDRKDHPIAFNCGEGRNLRNKVLDNLVQVRSLSLTGWSVKCLATGNVPKRMRLTYWGLTKLELQVHLGTHHETKVLACLLRSCPNLKELIVQIDHAVATEDHEDYGNRIEVTEAYWRSIQKNPHAFECLKNHLELITISNFEGNDVEMKFARFFWENTQPLKKMILYTMSSEWRRLKQMPSASRDAIIEIRPS